ncbi:MAG: phasin family protein [Bdellovibrio bacteriovorus]
MTTVNDTMNTVNEMTNKGFERMTSLGELNLKIFERVAARQMDALNLFMEHGIRVMKIATESKGYNEYFKGQVDAAKELSERLMTESKTNMSLAGEVRDDYRHWFEKNLAEVSADLRKGVPTAA